MSGSFAILSEAKDLCNFLCLGPSPSFHLLRQQDSQVAQIISGWTDLDHIT